VSLSATVHQPIIRIGAGRNQLEVGLNLDALYDITILADHDREVAVQEAESRKYIPLDNRALAPPRRAQLCPGIFPLSPHRSGRPETLDVVGKIVGLGLLAELFEA
jgi:hypothetical protein